MSENDFERWLRDAARDYNEPPEPPREVMWAEIRRSLDGSGSGESRTLDLSERRAGRNGRLRRWAPWALGLAAAAMLTVGFGLGRLTGPEPTPPPAPVARSEAGPSLPLQLVAADHMGEAEAMLTLFRASDRPDDREAAAGWARALLSETRLLLDSRVGEDPEMAGLLSDLELVLVQIASTGRGDAADRERIEAGMEQRQLLTKLRNASTAPVGAAL